MYEAFVGSIIPMAFGYVPQGWASCEGQLLGINQYQALFSLLGTTYGGNGTTTFALPDLRGRRVVGRGASPTLGNWTIGQKGGTETTTILLSQMPNHSHSVTVKANSLSADNSDPSGLFIGGGVASVFSSDAPDVTMNQNEASAGIAGGSQPQNIQSPYLAMYYNICQQGIYPPRP